MDLRKIDIADFDYVLPEHLIAQHPLAERDSSKLLLYKEGKISRDIFRNAVDHIPAGSLLVFNNTRVIRARLHFRKESGAGIEVLCLEPVNPSDYALSFESKRQVEWKCIVGNLKKWKREDLKMVFIHDGKEYILRAVRNGSSGDAQKIVFRWTPDDLCFGQVIQSAGHLPLPPYINRDDEEEDNIRYQTIYSRMDGSVAAPTAGLHFSERVLTKLADKSISRAELTLHVGAGTFKPVKGDDISRHEMHCEHFNVTLDTLELLLKNTGKIIAVGTTSVRTLESLFWIGVKMIDGPGPENTDEYTVSQWEPYLKDTEVSFQESLKAIISYLKKEKRRNIQASTSIMIVPGYKFRTIDGMFTNFHQPRSTLLLLVSAWLGDEWKSIYNYAVENNYRFLSYGDSSILFRNT